MISKSWVFHEKTIQSKEGTRRVALLMLNLEELMNLRNYCTSIFIDRTYSSFSSRRNVFLIITIINECYFCFSVIMYKASADEDTLTWLLNQPSSYFDFAEIIKTINTNEDHFLLKTFYSC